MKLNDLNTPQWTLARRAERMNPSVIREILKREGPLTKEEVVDKVLKERYLKKNTILVNLQNPKYFKKNKDKKKKNKKNK